MPKVSIVVPSYNRAEFIGATLKSIQAQTFKDFEVIFVDDGSTDNTEELVMALNAEDYRFKYFKQKNSERAVARSYGLELASADLLCLVDSDDLWYPEKLEKQIEIMDADPDIVLCYASVNRIDMAGNSVQSSARQQHGHSGYVFLNLLERNFIPSVTPMFRKAAWQKVGNQITEFIPYEDWDFWLKFSCLGKFHHIKEALGEYRLHPGQSVQNVKAQHIEKVTNMLLENNTNLEKIDLDAYLKMTGRTINIEGFKQMEFKQIVSEAYSLANLRFAYWYLVSEKMETAKERLMLAYSHSNKRLFDYRWYGLWISYYLKPLFGDLVTKFLGSFH